MHRLLMTLPLLIGLVATPALAAEPKSHSDHHPPAAAAKPDAKPQMQGCPMMSGQMAMNADGKAPPMTMPKGKAAGSAMMDGKDMHCMQASGAKPQTAQPPAAAAPQEHDHDHPAN